MLAAVERLRPRIQHNAFLACSGCEARERQARLGDEVDVVLRLGQVGAEEFADELGCPAQRVELLRECLDHGGRQFAGALGGFLLGVGVAAFKVGIVFQRLREEAEEVASQFAV